MRDMYDKMLDVVKTQKSRFTTNAKKRQPHKQIRSKEEQSQAGLQFVRLYWRCNNL
jgi:hypothetical protein